MRTKASKGGYKLYGMKGVEIIILVHTTDYGL